VVAALVLVPYAAWKGALRSRGKLPHLVAFGVNMALLTGTFYVALDRLGVGPGATVQFLGPILVLFWMRYRQARAVANVVWLAGLLAVAGTALLTRVWATESLDLIGLGAGLASAGLFASYLLAGEWLSDRVGTLTTVVYGALVAAIVWLVALPFWSQTYALPGGVWATLVWVGVGGTALPFFSEMAAIRLVASGIVGVVATAEPVIAAASAWVLLEQTLAPIQILGGLLVVAAVASVQRWGLPEIEVPIEAGR
jgi:threonine/homoserine efflux transporter RhtA